MCKGAMMTNIKELEKHALSLLMIVLLLFLVVAPVINIIQMITQLLNK